MKVLNKKTDIIPKGSVYIGRPSRYGNPFVLGRHGTREEVIRQFEVYARGRLKTEPDWLSDLVGKDLVCWCSPLPCHGDILLKLLESHE